MSKIALVLGASEGLGLATARALLEDGMRVCIVSRNADKLNLAKQALGEINSPQVISFVGDISLENTIINVREEILKKWGKVSILVNSNAGPKSGKVSNLTDSDWEEAFRKFALPVFRAIRIFLPDMIENNWGRIITIGSIAAKEPIENLDISNFIRSGFLGLHKSLARDIAKNNINVHMILPGSIMTSRTDERIDERAKKLSISREDSIKISLNKIPKGAIGDPQDVGNLIAFLCSEKANYLTGVAIPVDGGMSSSF